MADVDLYITPAQYTFEGSYPRNIRVDETVAADIIAKYKAGVDYVTFSYGPSYSRTITISLKEISSIVM